MTVSALTFLRRASTGVILAGVLTVATACTSDGSAAKSASTNPASTSPTSTSSVSSAPATTNPAPGSSTGGAVGTGTATGSAAGAPTSAAGASTASGPRSCAAADVSLTAESLGSASQQTFLQLRFTNTSTSVCVINGFPAVSLSLGGAKIGSAATDAPTSPAVVSLAPGAAATSRLVASTSCDAQLSDSVSAVLPNDSTAKTAAAQLRACDMVVSPVVAG